MNLATKLEEIRGTRDDVAEDDIRQAFGDYHNLLRWLANFLITDGKGRDAYLVDACTIAETQTPAFHEWLVHWAARATIGNTLQERHTVIAELASEYEKSEPVPAKLPLSKQDFLFLVTNSEKLCALLDPLCRFVLVLCGVAKNSYDEVATRLGISRSAVARAYSVAFGILEVAAERVPCIAEPVASPIDKEHTVARSRLSEA